MSRADSEDDLFQTALKEHQLGHLVTAKENYLKLLSINPKNAGALHLLGLLHAQEGDYNLAVKYIERALYENPNSALYHNNLANAYKNSGLFHEAKTHYLKAIEFQADYAEAQNNLATLYHQSKLWTDALSHYQAAIKIKPHYVEAHRNLGMLFLQIDDIDAAQKQFKNVIALHVGDWQSHYQLGNIHLKKNELEEALHYYLQVLSTRPDHIPTLNNLGVIFIKHQDDQKAIDYFTTILTLDKNNIEAANNSAALFMKHQRYENAIPHYEMILENRPDDFEAHYNLSVALMSIGKLKEAIDHSQMILSTDPHNSDVHANLGAIYIQKNDPSQARTHLIASLKSNPNNPIVKHMYDALTGNAEATSVPSEYIKNLFDHYSSRYNQHLQKTLQYVLPKALFSFANEYLNLQLHSLHILDIGCGTGLSGKVFSEVAHILVGVDLSPEMINIARNLHIYTDLITGDFNHALTLAPDTYHLIIGAEIFEYFGDLKNPLRRCKDYLVNGGHILFTIETSATEPFILQNTARFAHHPDYIEAVLAETGFTLIATKKTVARLQEGKDFYVLMVLAQNKN